MIYNIKMGLLKTNYLKMFTYKIQKKYIIYLFKKKSIYLFTCLFIWNMQTNILPLKILNVLVHSNLL